jgi:23S rRNA (adenine2030-N6)-methyltransferase
MNYRHAFHAGNFADVFKHICLARILVHLRGKPAPFRVIDTHAGAGLYDLEGEEANRTGEWREGVGRLDATPLAPPAAELAAPYFAALRAANSHQGLRHYPGSPLIAHGLLRQQDRLLACETEAAAAFALSRHLHRAAPDNSRRGDRCKTLRIDGWVALNASVPVKERRGLVFIDPPYERPDDFVRAAGAAVAAHRKWPTGVYLLWYPIKSRDGPQFIAKALERAAIGKAMRAELQVSVAHPDAGLNACGVIVINPPWKLAAELEILLPALVEVLGRDAGRGHALDWLDRIAARAPG